jgi:hypothetical protein
MHKLERGTSGLPFTPPSKSIMHKLGFVTADLSRIGHVFRAVGREEAGIDERRAARLHDDRHGVWVVLRGSGAGAGYENAFQFVHDRLGGGRSTQLAGVRSNYCMIDFEGGGTLRCGQGG